MIGPLIVNELKFYQRQPLCWLAVALSCAFVFLLTSGSSAEQNPLKQLLFAYSALANIQDSMIKGNAAWVDTHNVSFAKKISAGGIVAHDLAGSKSDKSGSPIVSEWVPYQSHMLLIGKDIDAATDPLGIGNTSDPNTIASADNLKFSETFRTLFIGEDSGNHVNNYLWAYNVDTKKLDRILVVF